MLNGEQEQSLLNAMVAGGLGPRKPGKVFENLLDGRIKRYELDNGKRGNVNGALCVYGNAGKPAAWFWSWADSVKQAWTSFDAKLMSETERAALRAHQETVNKKREAEQKRVWAEGAAKAEKLWNLAKPAAAGSSGKGADAHPYLIAKGVKPFGVRVLGDSLVLAARDATGRITNLQFINAQGEKRFLTGGKKIGSYYAIGKPGAVLLICEGFATGASLFEATGYAVAVAFDSGNLLAVGRAIRAKFPEARIVVCGDNDQATQGNPGRKKAEGAAVAIGGTAVVPCFEAVTS